MYILRGVKLEPDTYIGDLRIVSFAGTKNKTLFYECECDCGAHFVASKQHILSGRTKHCPGCARGYDLKGEKSGDWVANSRCGRTRSGLSLWRCTCSVCGSDIVVSSTTFRNGSMPLCDHNGISSQAEAT